jgi:hypothetical protein
VAEGLSGPPKPTTAPTGRLARSTGGAARVDGRASCCGSVRYVRRGVNSHRGYAASSGVEACRPPDDRRSLRAGRVASGPPAPPSGRRARRAGSVTGGWDGRGRKAPAGGGGGCAQTPPGSGSVPSSPSAGSARSSGRAAAAGVDRPSDLGPSEQRPAEHCFAVQSSAGPRAAGRVACGGRRPGRMGAVGTCTSHIPPTPGSLAGYRAPRSTSSRCNHPGMVDVLKLPDGARTADPRL